MKKMRLIQILSVILIMLFVAACNNPATDTPAASETEKAGENLENNPQTASHAAWAKDVLTRHPEFSKENARSILENEIGEVFRLVLCDAGVFKRNENGQRAFDRFVSIL